MFLVKLGWLNILDVLTNIFGVTIKNHLLGVSIGVNFSPIPSAHEVLPEIKTGTSAPILEPIP